MYSPFSDTQLSILARIHVNERQVMNKNYARVVLQIIVSISNEKMKSYELFWNLKIYYFNDPVWFNLNVFNIENMKTTTKDREIKKST